MESGAEKAQPGASKGRFLSPVSSTNIQKVRKQGLPKKTAAQTSWAGKVWADWAKPFVDEEEEKCELCEDFCCMQLESMKYGYLSWVWRSEGEMVTTIHPIPSMVYALH